MGDYDNVLRVCKILKAEHARRIEVKRLHIDDCLIEDVRDFELEQINIIAHLEQVHNMIRNMNTDINDQAGSRYFPGYKITNKTFLRSDSKLDTKETYIQQQYMLHHDNQTPINLILKKYYPPLMSSF